MDFILLNNDGSLNRQELKRYLQQGDHGVDNIFIVWNPGLSTDIVQAVFTLPNQTTNTALLTYKANYPYEADDPEELLEDPDALQEYIDNGGEISNGWVLTLTEEQTRYYGLLFTSVRFIRNGIVQVAYPFTLVINETGVRPETDSGVTLAQLDSYLLNLQSLVTGAVQQNTDSQLSETSENPVQNKVITTFVKNVVAGVYKIGGSDTPTNLDALTKDESLNGYVYNVSTNGSLTNEDASTLSVQEGDNVAFVWNDGEWYWDRMAGFIDTSNLATLNGQNVFTNDNTFRSNIIVDTGTGSAWSLINDSDWYLGINENGLRKFTFTPDAFIPKAGQDLGENNNKWKDLYLSGKVDFGNDAYITKDQYDRITLNVSDNAKIVVDAGQTYVNNNLLPLTATRDLGSNDYKWKDLYLSGKIYLSNNSTIETGSGYTGYTYNNLFYMAFGNSGVVFYKTVLPNSNNAQDLGSPSTRFASLYLGTYLNISGFIDSNLRPRYTNTYDLGTSSNAWKDLYLSGKVSLSGTEITQAADGSVQFTLSGDDKSIRPSWNGHYNLGASGYKWKDLYLSGNISDGTNQAAVTDIISAANNRLYKHRFILSGGAWNLSFDCMLKSASPITSPNVFVTFAESIRNSVGYRGQSGMPTELIVISRITGGSTPVIFYYTNSASGESSQNITTITDTIID